jgi:GTP-binding protein HflX
LVGVNLPDTRKNQVLENIHELKLLTNTAGGEVMETFVQNRTRLDPAYFIGRGKIQDIGEFVTRRRANVVIFDDDLSPAQSRNIEKIVKAKVIDRSGLILDIFAFHARTRESRIQVELAQLNYLLPRLTGAWTHFSRQTGGIGTRGPGETQLEVDRRMVQKRISDLKGKLKTIEKTRKEQQKGRSGMFRICLIGYTNVGKSTLLNALTRARALTRDKLFATLDATTRRCFFQGYGTVLCSDTVGFIRKLPAHLIASFRSTLQVINNSQFLIHVADPTTPYYNDQIITVNQVLDQLGCRNIRCHIVFNKIDAVRDPRIMQRLRKEFPDASFISAKRSTGIAEFKTRLGRLIENHDKSS